MERPIAPRAFRIQLVFGVLLRDSVASDLKVAICDLREAWTSREPGRRFRTGLRHRLSPAPIPAVAFGLAVASRTCAPTPILATPPPARSRADRGRRAGRGHRFELGRELPAVAFGLVVASIPAVAFGSTARLRPCLRLSLAREFFAESPSSRRAKAAVAYKRKLETFP